MMDYLCTLFIRMKLEQLAMPSNSMNTFTDVIDGVISDFDFSIWNAVIRMTYGPGTTTLKVAISRFELYLDDAKFRRNGYKFTRENKNQKTMDFQFCVGHWNHRSTTRSHNNSKGQTGNIKQKFAFMMLNVCCTISILTFCSN